MGKINLILFRTMIGVMLAFSSHPAQADGWALADLMNLLQRNKAGKALFIEKKYIGIVDNPIESSGELSFTAPDRLVKQTLKPKAESFVLEGDRLTIDQPNKRKLTISLREHPDISVFIESIRDTLSGDMQSLEKNYTLQLVGSAEKWQLTLIPTQDRMIKIVSRIIISGSRADVKSMNFEQSDGDHSEMFIMKVTAE
jgi:outer membrane lipoprotein-sorting protein